AEYLVFPWRMDSMAARLADSGVSKSGSPAPRLSTSLPSALRRLYLASMATVWDVEIRPVREARGFTRPSRVGNAAFRGRAHRFDVLVQGSLVDLVGG